MKTNIISKRLKRLEATEEELKRKWDEYQREKMFVDKEQDELYELLQKEAKQVSIADPTIEAKQILEALVSSEGLFSLKGGGGQIAVAEITGEEVRKRCFGVRGKKRTDGLKRFQIQCRTDGTLQSGIILGAPPIRCECFSDRPKMDELSFVEY